MRKIEKNKFDLTDEDLMRYNKHILLPEIDIQGQNQLLNKHGRADTMVVIAKPIIQ